MERIIFFPKKEFRLFNEGKKFKEKNDYKKAIACFERALKLKYLKKDCIKNLIECHIELHNYEEVYRVIEDEFVLDDVEEEYLLKKYLYTMVLDRQYLEAKEIIEIYEKNNVISNDLIEYLNDLLIIINKNLNDNNNNGDDLMLKYLTGNNFDDHIQIILNLDQLNYEIHKEEIKKLLKNSDVDSFVKYSLVKYLFDNKYLKSVQYANYFNETCLIKANTFIDILEDSRYTKPLDNVLPNVIQDYPDVSEFLRNIWLDFNIKHFPKLIDDIMTASFTLHILFLKSMDKAFHIDDICKIYNVNYKAIYQYFEC